MASPQIHVHQYDDDLRCRCGQKLVVKQDAFGRVQVTGIETGNRTIRIAHERKIFRTSEVAGSILVTQPLT